MLDQLSHPTSAQLRTKRQRTQSQIEQKTPLQRKTGSPPQREVAPSLMAGTWSIRARGPGGQAVLSGLAPDTRVDALQQQLSEKLGIPPERQELLGGFPPKTLQVRGPNQPVHAAAGRRAAGVARLSTAWELMQRMHAARRPPDSRCGPLTRNRSPRAPYVPCYAAN